jgi:hypothetical protein
MSAGSRVASLSVRLAALSTALAEIAAEVRTLERDAASGAPLEWLPAVKDAIEHMQLDCADARFAVRALREALPGFDLVQPRLL